MSRTVTPIIGLEIHIELKTKSKMFCGCSADYFGKEPNSLTCPTCLGLPGALPVPNKKAIEYTILTGLALNCEIPKSSKFDRKNYFYPDLPKGYQISQYDSPFCLNGIFEGIRIRRVHLEEDTGKLIHSEVEGEKCSLIDFNRSGVPLMEIVTEPDINSSDQAGVFLEKLRQTVRYLGVADADMEKGQMRCEPTVNLKIEENGKVFFSPLVEVKNINSFKFVKKAIDFEIKRLFEEFQEKRIEKKPGNKTTRGWDEKRQVTVLQRLKEEASDYRYFPEPDVPPFEWTDEQITNYKLQITKIELPEAKKERFFKQYGLLDSQAEIINSEKFLADFFEKAAEEGKKFGLKPEEIAKAIINKRVDFKNLIPREFVLKIKSLSTFSVSGKEIELLIEQVLKENPKAVLDFKKGKTQVLGFLIGQAQRKTSGKADPKIVQKILLEKLGN